MPSIKLENCTKCLKCVKDCPSDAIEIEQGIITKACIHCGHCVAICPEATIYPDADVLSKLEPSGLSSSDFRQLSANIRTCRSYHRKAVDKETLNMLVDNMKHYPSASNARPIEITTIKTPDLIERLNKRTGETLIKSMKLPTSAVMKPILKVLAPKMNIARLANYKRRFIEKNVPGSSLICHHAPTVMLFHAHISKFGMECADAYIWSTYTSIYANTLGLGTCFNGFITNAMDRSKSMRKEFGIPDGHRVHAAILIGHPKVKYLHEAGRDAPSNKVI
jgi:nitroreductase/NAD-dependent dihydropyrimidine dehydrogenase PreA subunit